MLPVLGTVVFPQPVPQREGSSPNKITPIALAILASLASFFLLPVEGALLVSAGAAALLAIYYCSSPSNGGQVPVVQPGHRVVVGERPSQTVFDTTAIYSFEQVYAAQTSPHIPAGRYHYEDPPIIHRVLDMRVPPAAAAQTSPHVPVGRGHYEEPPIVHRAVERPIPPVAASRTSPHVPVGRGHDAGPPEPAIAPAPQPKRVPVGRRQPQS